MFGITNLVGLTVNYADLRYDSSLRAQRVGIIFAQFM